jgi:hypothetical protein
MEKKKGKIFTVSRKNIDIVIREYTDKEKYMIDEWLSHNEPTRL